MAYYCLGRTPHLEEGGVLPLGHRVRVKVRVRVRVTPHLEEGGVLALGHGRGHLLHRLGPVQGAAQICE
eukprot:scaffold93234_cov61-Phaeocystis_antarctica.AAC.2